MIAILAALFAVAALGCIIALTEARACRARCQRDLSAAEASMREEIRRWQQETLRARAQAAQLARDAKTSAASRQQGREDILAIVPLLLALSQRQAAADSGASDAA